MALREIVTVPHEVLRRKARPVTDFGENLQTLIDDMVETMRQAPGVGLAAPQVGVAERVIVVEYYEHEEDEENEDEQTPAPKRLYTLVNPEITRASKEMEVGAEGCLSIPGVMGDVERHLAITVKAQNRRGQPVTLRLKDWTARIFQHEIDHLNGVLFTDRASKVWKPEGAVEDNV
ncbi:MAG: peptide deformylase [Anaerolineae bacterium CG_4_9_14_3_um_filter_57_17]|nr:peptide deformylase [bacterium]NCT21736.1 peptide deformylase [bacterium]OIO86434.1 MAG: peptide deformylase [Anaerolineae bacterium CG2_30_57_67]PJB68391.1 MAG: peptide deformylase [Anaerolineae bacterium CG_4_9_14_3_um_filter_57_17]